MISTGTKIVKTSDIVFNNLKKIGYSKYFNWIDYSYFKKQAEKDTENPKSLADKITDLFLTYNCELSDFADYEF